MDRTVRQIAVGLILVGASALLIALFWLIASTSIFPLSFKIIIISVIAIVVGCIGNDLRYDLGDILAIYKPKKEE